MVGGAETVPGAVDRLARPTPRARPAPGTSGIAMHDAARQDSQKGTTAGASALTRELADFLVLLSISLNKHAMYPPEHPQLAEAAAETRESLRRLLSSRPTLAIGVARQQLVIEGVATDPANPLLADLAERLHRHQVGAIQFANGVGEGDLRALFLLLAPEADRAVDPVGLRAAPDEGLVGISIFPMRFNQLALLEEDGAGAVPITVGNDLWIGLARAALEGESLDEDDERLMDPAAVAGAIDAHGREQAYDQVIVGYLLQISDELRRGAGQESAALRDRISRMIGSLRPETLTRLLEMGGDVSQRRTFLLDASYGMAVDAVVELVEAAALTSGQTISHAMARLLTKLATQAEAVGGTRTWADSELRDQVRRLVSGWSLSDPNPEEYRAILDRMAQAAPELAAPTDLALSEGERIIAMGLELDTIEEPVVRAIDALVAGGRVARVIELLDAAPAGCAAASSCWDLLTAPARMVAVLAWRPLDAAVVERLTTHAGPACIDALLAELARAESRSDRRLLLDRLVGFGVAACDAAIARLPGAPWFVIRNALSLLRLAGTLPAGWSPAEYLLHPDDRVRREALRLMLDHEGLRERAIVVGIKDADRSIARLALGAAARDCPRSAVATIVRRLADRSYDADLAPLAVRALASSGVRQGLETALAHASERTMFGRLRLAPRSPMMLAALSGLAHHWASDPRAAAVLKLAAAHGDAAVRGRLAPTPSSGGPAIRLEAV